jgi:hypothetical protein
MSMLAKAAPDVAEIESENIFATAAPVLNVTCEKRAMEKL